MIVDALLFKSDPVFFSFADLIPVRTGNFAGGLEDRDPLLLGQMGQLDTVPDQIIKQVDAPLYFFYRILRVDDFIHFRLDNTSSNGI